MCSIYKIAQVEYFITKSTLWRLATYLFSLKTIGFGAITGIVCLAVQLWFEPPFYYYYIFSSIPHLLCLILWICRNSGSSTNLFSCKNVWRTWIYLGFVSFALFLWLFLVPLFRVFSICLVPIFLCIFNLSVLQSHWTVAFCLYFHKLVTEGGGRTFLQDAFKPHFYKVKPETFIHYIDKLFFF